MRVAQCVLTFAVGALVGATSASAQPPATPPTVPLITKVFASSGNVAALIAKAKRDHKPGQASVIEPLLQLAPYDANLEYRTSVGPAAVHVHQDEFFYVIDGSGILVTGGKLTHAVQMNAENIRGDSIEGGTATPVAKGDFIVVPENTPHWFSAINGHIIDMSLHVPGSRVQ
ncbi:MAG TPA: cupin domain-containing protein [Steroidobacteraceae bacterium]|jgi:mannose-6-phosphate isomerase-like protein (cupin superfamily)|nr:cupin domain-containing protein [Steroidobacteraceae bacterium]